MKIDECIEILDALKQGKELEWRFKGDEVWKPLNMDVLMKDGDVRLNFHEKEYRVVEDRYRAYTGADEFVNEACNHECMLMRKSCGGQILVPSVITDDGVWCGDYHCNYSDLLDRVVWYDDGTPVGVKL